MGLISNIESKFEQYGINLYVFCKKLYVENYVPPNKVTIF